MSTYAIPSRFLETKITIFHYPSLQDSKKVVLIMKGLYGEHDFAKMGDDGSWDNKLISLLQENYHLVLVRSGRLEAETRIAKFEGKIFQEEVGDIEDAIAYCKKEIFSKDFKWSSVALSFGGTTLLGVPSILSSMETVIFANSGCGKSATTTKPLLSTLPETSALLRSMEIFKGNFFFLHGGKDLVVPLESKKMIYGTASEAKCKGWIEFPDLDHELQNQSTKKSELPSIVNRLINAFF
jgi:hypothetical protein